MGRHAKLLSDYDDAPGNINAESFNEANSNADVEYVCAACGNAKKSKKRHLVARIKTKTKIICISCKNAENASKPRK